MCVGLILCVGSLMGTVPFALGWTIACIFISVSASLSERYRLRVRALTRLEYLISVLLVILITLAIGFGLPPLLVWFIEHVVQPS